MTRPRVCGCGCGAPLPPGRRRWASSECERRGAPERRHAVGEERVAADGRVWVYDPTSKAARRDGWALRHRVVALAGLARLACANCPAPIGRFSDLTVLHANFRPGDDRPENLVAVCRDCARVLSFVFWLGAQPWAAGVDEADATLRWARALGRAMRGRGHYVGHGPGTSPYGGRPVSNPAPAVAIEAAV